MRVAYNADFKNESLNRGDVIVGRFGHEYLIEAVFFQGGEWQIQFAKESHEPAETN